ncbi:MAG: 5-oxoprolinase subunit PxpB [Anaerolineales bacterium]
MTLVPSGDSALLVQLGAVIDPALNRRVHALAERLRGASEACIGLREIVPGYSTLLVHYDPAETQFAGVRDFVAAIARENAETVDDAARRVEIPVQYDGPDLEFVAEHNHLSIDEVIAIHTASAYRVYMMGFTPGFAYLGEVDARIATPRLETPRVRVSAGSVGIAARQTGIYPIESPGGWRILGHTPLKMFDLNRESPFLLAPGDGVKFVRVDGAK